MEDEARRQEAFLQYATELVLGPFAGVVLRDQQDWTWDVSLLDSATVADLKRPAENFAQVFALSHG